MSRHRTVTGQQELPINWKWVPLGEILTNIIGGGTPSKNNPSYWQGKIPWLTIKDMRSRRPIDSIDHISEAAVKESATNIIPADTVIISTRVGLGKVIRVPYDATINQDLKALVPKDGIDKSYLEYWIVSIAGYLESIGSGTTVKGIRLETLRKIPFPLAPPDDQKHIVAEIEKQFSRLDEAVASLKRIQANLKRYKAAVLKTAVEGVERKLWQPIEHAIESIGQGWSPQCDREASPNLETWGVIKTTAVQPGAFLEEENKRLPEKLQPRPALEIQQNDILITRAGPRSRVGVACLVRSARPRLMVCDKVYRLRCREKMVRPDYLELVLNVPVIVDTLDELKTGISDSGVNLTQVRFNKLLIPLPPLTEQKVMIEEVERRLSVADELETTIETNLKRAERLRQTILQQAFSGRLV